MGGAWLTGGGTGSAAANGLNEAGGTARARSAVAARELGGPGRGPGGVRVPQRGLCPQSEAGGQLQRTAAEAERGARPPPGPPARWSRTRDWTRRAATGPHRPAAAMCDCFHMVLPTWPGAPGSGAPPPRLQPAPLGRVGSAQGRALGGSATRSAGWAAARAGWGRLWHRPRPRARLCAWRAARSCLPPPASRPLPVPVSRPPTPLCLSAAHFGR